MIFTVAWPTAESSRSQARAWLTSSAIPATSSPPPWATRGAVVGDAAWRAGLPRGAGALQDHNRKALAATVPLASVRLGDRKGSELGLNIAHGPVLAENVPCGPT